MIGPAGALALQLTLVALQPHRAAAQDAAPIADNSFLIEEAYNQEAGVVQHIGAFARPDGGEAWDLTFSQEWPLRGIRHQISVTIPVSYAEGAGTGLNDIGLTYRYQLRGADGGAVAIAPRLTALLPTGSEEKGRGSGGTGMQASMPLSWTLASGLVTHWNAGVMLVPASAPTYTVGASTVWLMRPTVNLLVEAVWSGSGGEEITLLNPGVRWAHEFDGGLQIVPGVAYTFDLGPTEDDGLFLYLSFEHPFRR